MPSSTLVTPWLRCVAPHGTRRHGGAGASPWLWAIAWGGAWALAGLPPHAWAQADAPGTPPPAWGEPSTAASGSTTAKLAPAAARAMAGSRSLLSRLQVSTSAAANSPTVINLQGDAHSGQVVRLQQNGLVFFE